ncbi:hypothetical protein LTR56_016887 [Elasticomyces elasticus]|nr:hypothetical protein LTR56_016887 [Elasticomyces elasticus]KAK3658656.1 hypothetical protein LTR22_008828 [Elasticomyces elasticus]KAK4913579.1 hypothetical protein LTR49_018098 [Elasticomyces elasticus]KAK5756593.1 hypothetical protein LTS12_013309 [Elasticomyces elasticus]
MEQVVIEGLPISSASDAQNESNTAQGQTAKQPTRPKIIFRAPTFQSQRRESEEKLGSSMAATPSGTTIHRVGPSSPLPSPSPRTVLLIACLIAAAQASPLARPNPARIVEVSIAQRPTTLENVGTIMSWLSTFLYLGSRLPQLFKNWRRKSTAGLSPHLFMAAFMGNSFYSAALLTNPCGWYDFGPHGGRGWVGSEGSDQTKWTLAALPFFLGAFGVLGLDASFLLYGDSEKVVVIEEDRWHRKHWRRVSGWMRGWVPGISESKGIEREALVGQHGDGYGTI